MEEYKYLIIGGGFAGGSAVEAIRQLDADGSLALVTQEPHRPYERPPLSKKFLIGEVGLDKVYMESPAHYAESDVQILTDARATGLTPESRLVMLADGRTINYTKLLLATGGRANRLPFPGNNLPGVFTLRTIEDAENIRSAAGKGKRVLILGGSFIGSEVASSLAQLGMQVTMIFLEHRLLEAIMPQELSQFLNTLYQDHGVDIQPETTVDRLEGKDNVEKAVLDNGEKLDVDLVVMGVGIKLNTELARRADLEMDKEDAVVVDENLCTSDAHIYAAGDIASWPDPTFGKRLRVEHWDVARQQGDRAGRNMVGDVEPYTALPYFFSDLFDLSFEVWGNLSSWERTVLRGSLDQGSFAYYYFDQDRLTGVLAVDRPNKERDTMQSLIKLQPTYDAVASELQDVDMELSELAEKVSA